MPATRIADGLAVCGLSTSGDKPSVAEAGHPYYNTDTGVTDIYDETAAAFRPDGVVCQAATFTEEGAGTYEALITLPAGAVLLDIIVAGVALWDAATSATLIAGDESNDDGFFTAVNLKATDLLAGETISFSEAGGKAGAYIANSQVSPRYYAAETDINISITSSGAGTAGRTRAYVIYAVPAYVAGTFTAEA